MTEILERVTLPDVPALEPEDGKRAAVREWRRELAAWLREGVGIAAHGEPWELATTGVRDVATLRHAAGEDVARHWSGAVPVAALVAGDRTAYGVVTGLPVVDPDTGAVWITTTRVTSDRTDHDTVGTVASYTDHEIPAGTVVDVTRGKGNR